MKTYGVIMAGGGGTRFWPLSRAEEPKQLLNLSGKDLMVNETIDRIATFTDKQDIFIVTNETQVPKMRTATESRIAADHILAEPAARNTSACIGYAALEIVKKYGDGIMCIFPSDHFIKNQPEFTRVLKEAIQIAEQEDKLITLGITPTFPSTGYGYIKFDATDAAYAKKVVEFKEKPDICNAIGAHHDEVEMTSLLAPIVQVCDAISGARPGARREIVEAYIKRLNDLEQLAMSYPGVTKTYAIQAGRELRVIVGADKIDDKATENLSGEIAKKIQDEMTYPGQVKITVIRETRAVSYAK